MKQSSPSGQRDWPERQDYWEGLEARQCRGLPITDWADQDEIGIGGLWDEEKKLGSGLEEQDWRMDLDKARLEDARLEEVGGRKVQNGRSGSFAARYGLAGQRATNVLVQGITF